MLCRIVISFLSLCFVSATAFCGPESNAPAVHQKMTLAESLAPYTGPVKKGVDTGTLYNKVMCGYQGWFMARGDGYEPGFVHWGGVDHDPPRCTVDLWPDLTEYDADELFPTNFRHEDGSPAYVFSSTVKKTVLRHFQWMEDYGIDGVFVQRFGSVIRNLEGWDYERTCAVLSHCREGANRHGRAFAVMYDVSFDRKAVDVIMKDWTRLVKEMQITGTPAYLNHRGHPVVALWGYGFRKFDARATKELFEFFKKEENGACTIMLGVPNNWVKWDDEKLRLLRKYAHIISPWNVGRYNSPQTAEAHFAANWPADLEWCRKRDKDYYAVVFPGFSWTNLKKGHDPLNAIPRLNGDFFWSQVEQVKQYGMNMAYVAMFDEMDEGTAIFKCTNNPPVGSFVTYEGLPSDHYLKLTGKAGRFLRGETDPVSEAEAKPDLRADTP
ncbi:MAG: glycoside hydrolase family 71/99-like protein [Pontiellaceae bacterium]|jgi:hypothetical protein|nr:glycoside hydrolase family 71/99-like protein [Pontiellaceae bacterium]